MGRFNEGCFVQQFSLWWTARGFGDVRSRRGRGNRFDARNILVLVLPLHRWLWMCRFRAYGQEPLQTLLHDVGGRDCRLHGTRRMLDWNCQDLLFGTLPVMSSQHDTWH